MPNNICPDQFEEWEEDYDDWKDCLEDRDEAKEDYLMAWAAAEIACPGAIATAETIVGGVVLGAACLAALWKMYDAADDWSNKIDDCNEKARESNKQGDKYKQCVADHKNDAALP